jgi:DNA polymerase III subunit delta
MTAMKPAQALALAGKPGGATPAILIHGPDAGGVHDLALRLVKAHAGEVEDPFNLVRIDDAELVKDPARLPDEYGALSLLGGRRTIWISGANTGLAKAIGLIAGLPSSDNLIIAEGTNFLKTHKLRTLFETTRTLAIVQCYEDSPEDLRNLCIRTLKEHGLAIDDDALELLVASLGADRFLSRSEIEKLALFAMGEKLVTAAMVSAACGDASSAGSDELLDAAFDGQTAETIKLFSKLLSEGQDPSRLLSAAAIHLAALQRQQASSGDGGGRQAYLPAKRQAALQRQSRQWSPDRLEGLGATLAKAVFACRTGPDLADAIASRTFLGIAWQAARR